MKTLLAMFAVVLNSAVLADELATLSFPDATIGVPPLSLIDAANQRTSRIFADGAAFSPTEKRLSDAKRQLVSHMPVIVPRVVSEMPIKSPDASVDYKMIVQAPDVDSAK